MLPLRWTEHAVTQLEGVVDYISATSPVYAEGVVLRELVSSPYRMFYRPRQDCVEVLAIVHARQLLSDAF